MTDAERVDARLVRSAANALGISRFAELLVIFDARVGWLSTAPVTSPYDIAAIIAVLHQSRGSAASLGFTRLHRVLTDIERELDPGTIKNVDGSYTGALQAGLDGIWQASLAAAASHVPALRRHPPFSSKR